MLSQGEPRDTAVHFDICIKFYNGIVPVSLSQQVFFVGLCLQTAVNYLLESDKY